jgi:hypothetical protein
MTENAAFFFDMIIVIWYSSAAFEISAMVLSIRKGGKDR